MEYKYFLSVCVCIRNEAKYIEEFIKHYIGQGVDHFYIINNNSDDNIEEVIEKSIYKLNVTLITDNREMNILKNESSANGHQKLLIENLYNLIKEETEWAIIVDADEFMHGKNGYTIKSYLYTIHENIGCIYVVWNIINPCKDENNNLLTEFSIKNNVKRINHDLMSNLSESIRFANDFGKSIFRTRMVIDPSWLWLHLVKVYGNETINNYGMRKNEFYDNGNKIEYSEANYRNANVALNHYAIRNLEDYDKKNKQLDVMPSKRQFISGLFEMLELDDSFLVIDDSLAKSC
jgi:glycosyltransferase involved in cell wall biosynthesis